MDSNSDSDSEYYTSSDSISSEDVQIYEYPYISACFEEPVDKHLLKAYRIIREVCARGNMPGVISDRAKAYFKKYYEIFNDKVQMECKCLAVTYMAARVEGVPRSFKEITALGGGNSYQIAATYKKLLQTLNVNPGNVTCTNFIDRFGDRLELPQNVISEALRIATEVMDYGTVCSRSPTSIAATVLYLTAKKRGLKTQPKDVEEISGVPCSTIAKLTRVIQNDVINMAKKGKDVPNILVALL